MFPPTIQDDAEPEGHFPTMLRIALASPPISGSVDTALPWIERFVEGITVESFGAASSPCYEKAMMCRALENAIFFASVGYSLRYQEAATALISPEGECLEHLPYGRPGLLVADIDPGAASRIYARRLAEDDDRLDELEVHSGRGCGRGVEVAGAVTGTESESPDRVRNRSA